MSKAGPGPYDQALDTGVEGESLHLSYALDTIVNKARPKELIVPRENLTLTGLMRFAKSLTGSQPQVLTLQGKYIPWTHGWFTVNWILRNPTPQAEAFAAALEETSVVEVKFAAIKADQRLIDNVTQANWERLEAIRQEEANRVQKAADKAEQTKLNKEAMRTKAHQRAERDDQRLLEKPFDDAERVLTGCEKDFSEKASDLLANIKMREKTVSNTLRLASDVLKRLDKLVGDGNADQVDSSNQPDLLAETQKTLTQGFDQVRADRNQFRAELNVARSGKKRSPTPEIDHEVESSNDNASTRSTRSKRYKATPTT